MRVLAKTPLKPELFRRMNAYWRAANYLSVGQIYLLDNPLLKKPLTLAHIKPRLLGHWGTTPGQNFVYVHLNRVIKEHDLEMFYVSGPGHGGPGVVANVYLEGTYTEYYPEIAQDEDGMRRLFGSSRSRAGSRATWPRTPRAPSTRGGSWGTRWPTPTVRPSTTPS